MSFKIFGYGIGIRKWRPLSKEYSFGIGLEFSRFGYMRIWLLFWRFFIEWWPA